jgi:DNA-binding CsgD family transcriptional regulator
MVSAMRRSRIAVLTAAGALVAAGSGVAVATTGSNDPEAREQAVLADAAKRLDVDASALRDALAEAEDAQLDADVKAGKLTQEQADEIKRHRTEEGTVLGIGPGKPHGGMAFDLGGGPIIKGIGGPDEVTGAAAKALGLSEDELFQRLREGKTLEEIAKAEGKSLDDVKAAMKSAMKAQLDEAVKAGKLTQAEADDILSHTTEKLGEGMALHARPGGPPPPGLFFGGPGLKGPDELTDAAAKALGISRDELFQRLRDGKTLQEIAKAEGKSLDDVKAAMKTAMKAQLDEAVKAGKLTQAQADELVARSTEHLGDFGRSGLPKPPPELPAAPPAEPALGNA